MKKRVLVAMSGGVDSSVAAVLLQEAGYECVGVTMRLYENELVAHSGHTCCSLDDVEDARHVAHTLGMEYYVFDFSPEFEEKVIQKFVRYYERGWTPNPCIDCNRYLKFDHLLKRARELDCEAVATGHYARVVEENGVYCLKRGVDHHKDQSYALYSFDSEILAHTLLPVGVYKKQRVREIAEAHGLINARKHDSQDICFVPDGDYVSFLSRYTGQTYSEGDLVDSEGNVLGKHHGAVGYTIGQRRGLGIAAKEPLYVIDKDMATNRVCVGTKTQLMADSLLAADWNWIGEVPREPIRATVKIRYNAKDQPAVLRILSPDEVKGLGKKDTSGSIARRRRGNESVLSEEDTSFGSAIGETAFGSVVAVTFDDPQRAIAPGQAAVAYQGDTVLGGGTIVQVLPPSAR